MKKFKNQIFKNLNIKFYRATIEVDEVGTVATAATETEIWMKCMPDPPAIINVDSPFLYFIRLGKNVLFAGRLVRPEF